MGEYAKRISDGQEIKIGTCEEMLYLRFSDRHKVSALPGSVDVSNPQHAGQLLYRLPFPDEDANGPGNYSEPFRRQRLYDKNGIEYKNDSLADDAGIMQLTHRSGLLLNVPCFHGMKLPDVGKDVQAFWNGKTWSLELASLRATYQDGIGFSLHPVIGCRWCRKLWRVAWTDVWEFIPETMQRAIIGEAGINREHAVLALLPYKPEVAASTKADAA